jgi:hypothetical protein
MTSRPGPTHAHPELSAFEPAAIRTSLALGVSGTHPIGLAVVLGFRGKTPGEDQPVCLRCIAATLDRDEIREPGLAARARAPPGVGLPGHKVENPGVHPPSHLRSSVAPYPERPSPHCRTPPNGHCQRTRPPSRRHADRCWSPCTRLCRSGCTTNHRPILPACSARGWTGLHCDPPIWALEVLRDDRHRHRCARLGRRASGAGTEGRPH